MTEHCKGVIPHQIRVTEQTSAHEICKWDNPDKNFFQNCCNSKAPMTVQWISLGFYNSDTLLQFLPDLIGAPSSLPHHFSFER